MPLHKRRLLLASLVLVCLGAGNCKPRRSQQQSAVASQSELTPDSILWDQVAINYIRSYARGPGIHVVDHPLLQTTAEIIDRSKRRSAAVVEAWASRSQEQKHIHDQDVEVWNIGYRGVVEGVTEMVHRLRESPSTIYCIGPKDDQDPDKFIYDYRRLIKDLHLYSPTTCSSTGQSFRICDSLETCEMATDALEALAMATKSVDKKYNYKPEQCYAVDPKGHPAPGQTGLSSKTIHEASFLDAVSNNMDGSIVRTLIQEFKQDIACLPELSTRRKLLEFRADSLDAMNSFYQLVEFEAGKRPFPYLIGKGREFYTPLINDLKSQFNALVNRADQKIVADDDPTRLSARIQSGLMFDEIVLPALDRELASTELSELYIATQRECRGNDDCEAMKRNIPKDLQADFLDRADRIGQGALHFHLFNHAAVFMLEMLGKTDIRPNLKQLKGDAVRWSQTWLPRWRAYENKLKAKDMNAQRPERTIKHISPYLAEKVLELWFTEAFMWLLPFRHEYVQTTQDLAALIEPNSPISAGGKSQAQFEKEAVEKMWEVIRGPAGASRLVQKPQDGFNPQIALKRGVDPFLKDFFFSIDPENQNTDLGVKLYHNEIRIAEKTDGSFHSLYDEYRRFVDTHVTTYETTNSLMASKLKACTNLSLNAFEKLGEEERHEAISKIQAMDYSTLPTTALTDIQEKASMSQKAAFTEIQETLYLGCLYNTAVEDDDFTFFTSGIEPSRSACWQSAFKYWFQDFKGVEQGFTGRRPYKELCGVQPGQGKISLGDLRRRLDDIAYQYELTEECRQETAQLEASAVQAAINSVSVAMIGGSGGTLSVLWLRGAQLLSSRAVAAAVGEAVTPIIIKEFFLQTPSAIVRQALMKTLMTTGNSLVQSVIFDVGTRSLNVLLGQGHFNNPNLDFWSDWGVSIASSTVVFTALAPVHFLGEVVAAGSSAGVTRWITPRFARVGRGLTWGINRAVPFATTSAFFAEGSERLHHMVQEVAKRLGAKVEEIPNQHVQTFWERWGHAIGITAVFEYTGKRIFSPLNAKILGQPQMASRNRDAEIAEMQKWLKGIFHELPTIGDRLSRQGVFRRRAIDRREIDPIRALGLNPEMVDLALASGDASLNLGLKAALQQASEKTQQQFNIYMKRENDPIRQDIARDYLDQMRQTVDLLSAISDPRAAENQLQWETVTAEGRANQSLEMSQELVP